MHQPPSLYTKLLKWFCRESLYDELQGDLEEVFYSNLEAIGYAHAAKVYRREVIQLFRPSVIKKTQIKMPANNLLPHYLKTTFRNLVSNKVSTAISLFGLTVGIATSAFIFQFNQYEESYDAFHKKAVNIYRIQNNIVSSTSGEVLSERAATFYGAGQTIVEEINEVVKSTTVWDADGIFTYDNNPIKEEKILYTDASFFEIFDFPLTTGNAADLGSPGSLFISESMATKMFNDQNPMGKIIRYDGLRTNTSFTLEVKGVFKDLPPNSSFEAEAIVPLAQLHNHHVQNSPFGIPFEQYVWRWNEFYTYLEIDPKAKKSAVEEKVNQYYHKYRATYDEANGRHQSIVLQNLPDIHLRPGLFAELSPTSDRDMIRFFYLIAVLILLIAWINYINMSTAVAVKRAREVGVRKVLGAVRKQLVVQFLLESLVVNVIATILAAILIIAVAPFSVTFLDKDIFHLLPQMSSFWILVSASLLIGSLLAGFYPAIILSSFRPAQVLKTSLKYTPQGILLRKGLVIFQFTIASFLLSGAIAVQSQLKFMLEQDPGFNMDRTLVIETPPGVFRDSTYQSRIRSFLNFVDSQNGVEITSTSSLVPGRLNRWSGAASLSSNPDQESVYMSRMSMGPNFVDVYGLDVIAGRNFRQKNGYDASGKALVNTTAAKNLGFDEPEQILGETLRLMPSIRLEVIGVVADYIQNDMHSAIAPMLIQLDSTESGYFVSVKFNGDPKSLLTELDTEYSRLFPRNPFVYQFLDQSYQSQYEADQKFQQIFNFFTSIAILIACLGLFGLSMFMVVQKRKEVSIRKVLGASQLGLVSRLLKEYWQLIGLAMIVSIPVSCLMVNEWLDSFAYRTEISLATFLIPMILLSVIVLLTVSQSTILLINASPIKNLRND